MRCDLFERSEVSQEFEYDKKFNYVILGVDSAPGHRVDECGERIKPNVIKLYLGAIVLTERREGERRGGAQDRLIET